MQDSRKLKVWERSHALTLEVRRIVTSFPATGYSELKAQMVSSAESISTNIVEECGAASKKDFARFLDFGIKSSFELDYQLQLALDYRLISQAEWERLMAELIAVRRMLFGLRRSVLGLPRREGDEKGTQGSATQSDRAKRVTEDGELETENPRPGTEG